MQAGSKVVFDLASWEVVQRHHDPLWALIQSGHIHALLGNEDEAAALHRCLHAQHKNGSALPKTIGKQTVSAASDAATHIPDAQPRASQDGRGCTSAQPADTSGACAALREHMSDDMAAAMEGAQALATQHCELCVVTLGEHGCLAAQHGQASPQLAPAAHVDAVVDTTGAGDFFAAGFIAGLLQHASLLRCCEMGCSAGAAAVQVRSLVSLTRGLRCRGRVHGTNSPVDMQ